MTLPLPILTPRLLLRPLLPGEGALAAAAVRETWDELHRWMGWAQRLDDITAAYQEERIRMVTAALERREEFNLVAFSRLTGEPLVWCGFHSVDWPSQQCETGYWTRQTAQRQGYATEACNALIRYAFQALGMQRLGIGHAAGNEGSRRIIARLGFVPEGLQRRAMLLPTGRLADRLLYARLDAENLPPLNVSW